ncbi:leucine-rich repeat-containing protein 18 [Neosynchiropus ocellatus]
MPKGKKASGTKVTLKIATKAIRMTRDGNRRLTLSNMGITTFPKCLFKLTSVDEIDLSRNQIQKLPECIGQFMSLRWLDLHSNKLESVPNTIGNLVRLTHLNLSNNFLTSPGLPETLGNLANLKSLNLGMNQLDELPSSMVELDNLQELGLFDNRFTSLPDCIKFLHNLKKLNMKRNLFSLIHSDGEWIAKETSTTEESMYLVYESDLCKRCRKRCNELRENFDMPLCDMEDEVEEKRIMTFHGLITPNSVAQVNQSWRIRQEEHGANE